MKRNSEHVLIEWLVISAQEGDADAANQLALRLYPKLIQFSSRQLQNTDEAKDVVQNAFEVIAKNIQKVRDPAAFVAWAYQMTYRKGVDHIRQQQRRRILRTNYEEARLMMDQEDDTQCREDPFDFALAALDSSAYQIIHLFYLEGFNIKDISESLDIPEGTVKSRLHTARKKLKTITEKPL